MWTSCDNHSVISMWQRHSFHLVSSRSVARFWRIVWICYLHLMKWKKFQNQKLVNESCLNTWMWGKVTISVSLNFCLWRINTLFARSSKYVLIGNLWQFQGTLCFFQNASIPEDGTCYSKHGSKEKLSLRWTGNLGSSLWKEQPISNFLLWIPTWIYLDSLDCKLQVKNRKIALTLFASVFPFISSFFFLLLFSLVSPLCSKVYLWLRSVWGEKTNFRKLLMIGELLNENCC